MLQTELLGHQALDPDPTDSAEVQRDEGIEGWRADRWTHQSPAASGRNTGVTAKSREGSPLSGGMKLADSGRVNRRTNLPPTLAGTNAGCAVATAAIGERGVHGAVGYAHSENHTTGAAASAATERAVKTTHILGGKVLIRVATNVF